MPARRYQPRTPEGTTNVRLTLPTPLATWADREADREGKTLSYFIAETLEDKRREATQEPKEPAA